MVGYVQLPHLEHRKRSEHGGGEPKVFVRVRECANVREAGVRDENIIHSRGDAAKRLDVSDIESASRDAWKFRRFSPSRSVGRRIGRGGVLPVVPSAVQ